MKKLCLSCCKENNANALACGFCLAPFPKVKAQDSSLSVIKTLPTKHASVENDSRVAEVESVLKSTTITSILSQKEKSTVYLAENILSQERFAVKVLQPSNNEERQRFLSVAASLERLQNPGAPRAYQSGSLPSGRVFVVLEYIDGKNLRAYLKEKRSISVAKTVAIGGQVLVALDVVHRAGILHRNLRPEHICLRDYQGQKVITLIGFGFGSPESPDYVSPEQTSHEPLSVRSDLYSFGVLLFEILASRLPFLATSGAELLTMQREEMPPAPSVFAPSLPKDLDQLILLCLEKHPDDRPASAQSLKDQLLKTIPGASVSLTSSYAIVALKPLKKTPRWKFAAVSLGLLLVGLLGLLFIK